MLCWHACLHACFCAYVTYVTSTIPQALADVFVDNPTYNAHSTAMDTLWGALPFVSLPEACLALRV